MKRQFLFLGMLLTACIGMAQTSRLSLPNNIDGTHIDRLNDHHADYVVSGDRKDNWTHKLSSFRTTDGYETCSFHYDQNYRLIAVGDDVPSEYRVIDSLTYDAQGHIVRLDGYQKLGGIWKHVYYIEYTYDDKGDLRSRTNYNFYQNQWTLGGVYNYTYNDNHQITLSELEFSGVLFQKTEYFYADGRIDNEKWYSYDGMDLAFNEKIRYNYNSDNRLSLLTDSVSEDNGNTWEFYGRETYVYDGRGNCTERHAYDATQGEATRSEYIYDYNVSWASTLMPQHPELVRPRIYANSDVYTTEHYYAVDVDHVLQYMCDYEYNVTDINDNAIVTVESMNINVFPNPTHANVTLSGAQLEGCTIQLVDLAGRPISSQKASASTVNLNTSNMPRGIYMVRISNAHSTAVQRIVIE